MLLQAVPGLHGEATLRPADVLLRLAVATRPLYHADLHDMYAYWGLLRYLGIFDSDRARNPKLMLSAAGQRIVGNQRRVTSEELGIGFAALIAERWMRLRQPGNLTQRIVDVDIAVAQGSVFAGGAPNTVRQTGGRRPDYLLIADGDTRSGLFHVAVLESKGSKFHPYAHRQLSRAATQLGGLSVGGRCPTGLAVSTVLSSQDAVTYYALEHRPNHTADGSRRTRLTDLPAVADVEEVFDVEVDMELIDSRQGDRVYGDRPDSLDAAALAAAALRGSWASLADFSGSDSAFERWASPQTWQRLGRTSADRPVRVTRTVGDLTVVGVQNLISLPGGQLEVLQGLEASVDDALANDGAEHVLAAQLRIITSELPQRYAMRRAETVVSVATDGSAMVLTPR